MALIPLGRHAGSLSTYTKNRPELGAIRREQSSRYVCEPAVKVSVDADRSSDFQVPRRGFALGYNPRLVDKHVDTGPRSLSNPVLKKSLMWIVKVVAILLLLAACLNLELFPVRLAY